MFKRTQHAYTTHTHTHTHTHNTHTHHVSEYQRSDVQLCVCALFACDGQHFGGVTVIVCVVDLKLKQHVKTMITTRKNKGKDCRKHN
jgi:hypothetical protein